MAKTFKRIAALALALALVVCFAVSASAAVTVTTKTTYASAEDKLNVNVDVTLSGDRADYVTYYATNPKGEVVYIDQADFSSGTANIKYQTAATSLKGDVTVGYTNGSATSSDINAKTVTLGTDKAYIPSEETAGTVTFAYTLDAGYTVDATCVTPSAGTVTAASMSDDGTKVSISLSGVTGDTTLTITPKEVPNITATATYLAGAGVTVTEETKDDYAANGNRRVTVIGAVSDVTDNKFGVIIKNEEITSATEGKLTAEEFTALADYAWAAEVKGDNGAFAVQIVDVDGTTFTSDSYYAAVYAKNSDGSYTITDSGSFTIGQ